jgi:hypothetical protein
MRPTAILLAAAALAACGHTPTERQAALPPAGQQVANPHWIDTQARRNATSAVNVIGTPFYALFKATACVATAAIAAPAAGLIGLTDRPDKERMRRQLDDGVAANCGGSYVLRS